VEALHQTIIKDLEQALLKVQYDTTKVFKVGGKDVMDIVLDGEIEILYTRVDHGCRRDGRKISNG
jgi:hypothetical protein